MSPYFACIIGGIGLEREAFLAWLSKVDKLSEARKIEKGEVLASLPAGEALLAAVEVGVGEDRTCPRCARCSGQRQVAGISTRSLSILQSNLRSGDEYTNERFAPQKILWLTYGECSDSQQI